MKYLVARVVKPKGVCVLNAIENVARSHVLTFGGSIIGEFPDDARFSMDSEFPKDIALADAFVNTSSLLVVSERFKNALENIPGALQQNEVLPVRIVNHKRREEKSQFFVIHQVARPPVLDETLTLGTRLPLDPARYHFVTKIVVKEQSVPPELMLFRADQYPRVPLMRSDLVERLRALNLVGIDFQDPAKHQSLQSFAV